MEWLLFLVAFFLLPDEDTKDEDRRNRYIFCGVVFALGVALRIFYASR